MPLHVSTILARTPHALQKQLVKLTDVYTNKGHTCLFALSANFPFSQDLADTVDILTKFNNGGHTLGCLSDSFSGVNFSQSTGNHIWDNDNYSSPILSCSIGIFDSSRVVHFRSTIPGKTQPQVGRWHSFRKRGNIDDDKDYGLNSRAGTDHGTVSWEDIWNRSASKDIPLPEELRSLDQATIDSIIFFCDLQPEGLSESLRALPPTTTQLGLIAASSHFISGRPVTLCRDGFFFGEGAVGVALLKPTSENKMVSSHVDFLGIRKLSGPLTVTSREGNMINGLNSSNPTQLLLSAICLAGINMLSPNGSFRDNEEFSLGLVSPTGEISRTYKITAGDPSKRGGSLSLDADIAPLEGSTVQFLHRPFTAPLQLPASLFHRPSTSSTNLTLQQPKQTFAFLSVPEPTSDASQIYNFDSKMDSTAALVLPQTFLSPSVNGFILSCPSVSSSAPKVLPQDVSQPIEIIQAADIPQQDRLRKSESPWKCSLPGALGVIEWQ